MKFCVENDLSIFEFHDSYFNFVSFDGCDLTLSAEHINIHKNTIQNPSNHDMEIGCAQLVFKSFSPSVYEPGRVWKTAEDGNSYPVGPQIVFTAQDAMERFLAELQNGFTVLHFEEEGCGKYSIGGIGLEPYFTIEFSFDHVVVCWDEYKTKAWYELHRQYSFDAVLSTASGDKEVKLKVIYHESDDPDQSPAVSTICSFNGKEYIGRGSDYLWIDAFADLQKHLPEGVTLKCCLTCRHGNLCPIGDNHNELFCTKDVSITQKSDLYFYTEDSKEQEKRLRQYCSLCEDFMPQTESFFTYNDYLYFLKK